MRRVRWARLLVVVLAIVCVEQWRRGAEQARRVGELEGQVADLRFAAEQERVKLLLREVEEARLLVHGRREDDVHYCRMGCNRGDERHLKPRVRAAMWAELHADEPSRPRWRVVDYELATGIARIEVALDGGW